MTDMTETTGQVEEGTLLWEPTQEQREGTQMHAYMLWLKDERGLGFADYDALWSWSVEEPGAFWQTIWDYFEVISHSEHKGALTQSAMPGAKFFEGATLNYAEHSLRRRDDHLALIYRREDGLERKVTYKELYKLVARAQAGLKKLGVVKGDRVVAFALNTPETLAAFLASASLGAVWSSTAPEFGVNSVLDRFSQIEPKVLFASPAYHYNGKVFDRREAVAQISKGLGTLAGTVILPGTKLDGDMPDGSVLFEEFLEDSSEIEFEAVDFDHPLWILYSSGTTGLPKAIVQGHGGILLEHFKALSLHCDLGPDDRFFWFTTTGWMMWNFLISQLLLGGTAILYDGSPGYPDMGSLWRFAADIKMSYFGTSAPYLVASMKEGLKPGEKNDLSALKGVGSTGAPLPAEGFAWVYEAVKSDLVLGSVSGGSDVCTAFVLSNPMLPVHAGEIQCRGLGCKVEAWDTNGKAVVDEVGELVMSAPMPSMPVFFWNDEGNKRLKESYFSVWDGVWRHGDWIKVSKRGSCVIYGRSDSTLNRGGVRMGTSEFYRVVEQVPQVADSLVVDTGDLDKEGKLWLFVVLKEGEELNDALVKLLRKTIRERLSPRHVPDDIMAIDVVPRTLNGKKLEVPIKKILNGGEADKAINKDTLANPLSIKPFVELAQRED